MCGIAGILSTKKRGVIPDVIASLSDLEYRGYDSAGIATISEWGIKTYKCLGAPSQNLNAREVYKSIGGATRKTKVAIGHNRWATHGVPTLSNAHPHTDCHGEMALVHNGTIINYETLRDKLKKAGHIFKSDTDTEVIAHQIEEARKHSCSTEKAILQSIALLEGSFGLVILLKDDPNKLYLAKNGSPINIGLTKDSFIVASSVNAILRHTDKFISLKDGEFAVLDVEKKIPKYKIFNFTDKTKGKIKKEINTIKDTKLQDLSKGEHPSFMLKEIFEQPSVTKTTILGRYDKKAGNAILGGLIDYEEKLGGIKNIYTIACGTAHNAGVLGKEIIELITEINVRNEIASEFRYKKNNLNPQNTALFAISQSGETADTLKSVKKAKHDSYDVFGIVNVVGSAIAQEVDAGMYTRAGAEVGVASTKAFTSQAAIFYLLALKLARGRSMQIEEGRGFIKNFEEIPGKQKETLKTEQKIKKLVNKYAYIKNINFLGRGIHLPIANEAALKFKELTYMEAGSYPLGELKHGPMAVIDEECLSVVIIPKDNLFEISKNSIEQIKSKGGKVLVITDESAKNDPILKKVDDVIFIPTLKDPLFYPLVEIIPLQLFAAHFAVALGKDVDKPRNLAKSVTVE
jgi:glucosamine--fructose-6-phosphate aminotransferase (isomerizing)